MDFLDRDATAVVNEYLWDPLCYVRQELHERFRIGTIWLDVVVNDVCEGVVVPIRKRDSRARVIANMGRDHVFSFELIHDFGRDNEFLNLLVGLSRTKKTFF